MTDTFIPPVHPGEILNFEFMEPLGLKAYTLAKNLDMPRSNIESVVRGQRSLSAEFALRLSRYFGNSAQFWINAQSFYDLECAKERLGSQIEKITPRAA
ncbi:MAG: HigA family addiction module antitoxin [Robiginitomaculum sp.]